MALPSTAMRLRQPTTTMLRSYLDAVQLRPNVPAITRAPHSSSFRTWAPRSLSRHCTHATKRVLSTTSRLSRSSVPPSSRKTTSDRTFEKAALAKPSKDFVPSHPPSSGTASRARRDKTYIYGGELTPAAKAMQAKKRYPNMFPSEGTFLHWFLTNRTVHAIIALGVLTCLASTIFVLEFRRKTPYLDLLPTWSQFFTHPLDSMHQVWAVYNQHVAWDTQRTQLAREKNIEDARKRKAYRVAHGLERPEEGLQGGVEGVAVEYGEKAGMVKESRLSEKEQRNLDEDAEFERKVKDAFRESVVKAGGNPDMIDKHREQQGKPKELKKWFGIW